MPIVLTFLDFFSNRRGAMGFSLFIVLLVIGHAVASAIALGISGWFK